MRELQLWQAIWLMENFRSLSVLYTMRCHNALSTGHSNIPRSTHLGAGLLIRRGVRLSLRHRGLRWVGEVVAHDRG